MKNLFAFLIFIALSVMLGISSARYMVDDGFSLVVGRAGPWRTWMHAGSRDADPYTRAHFARTGQLPITAASGLTFFAQQDDKGRRLSSDCEYEIIARPQTALWWTVALYDEEGKLIPNKANRYAFNSQNLAMLSDGTQRIVLAPEARPGHWLPSGEDHDLTLVLHIIRPLSLEQAQNQVATAPHDLPRIHRVGC